MPYVHHCPHQCPWELDQISSCLWRCIVSSLILYTVRCKLQNQNANFCNIASNILMLVSGERQGRKYDQSWWWRGGVVLGFQTRAARRIWAKCVGHLCHFKWVSLGFFIFFFMEENLLWMTFCHFMKQIASYYFPAGGEAATPGFVPGTGTFLRYSVPVGWWLVCSPPTNANGSLRHDEGYVFWRLPREQC
jgi:hypothetical protein